MQCSLFLQTSLIHNKMEVAGSSENLAHFYWTLCHSQKTVITAEKIDFEELKCENLNWIYLANRVQ